jgi:hypothetical protein
MQTHSSKTRQIKVRTIQMGDQFLYLPVYYAINNNLFGYLGDLDKTYTFWPPNERYINAGTDKAVFDLLDENRFDSDNTILMALGDPRSVGSKRNWSSSKVRLVGALITGTPFWAIDHGENNTNTLEDLCKFTEIVSYQEGTTSYDLVRSLLNDYDIEKKVSLIEKEDGTEIDLAIRDSKPGQVIISPDIVKIVQAINRKRSINIEFPLGSDHQLCDLLITAIATTKQTIEDHEYFVKAYIKAIQRAVTELKTRSPKIIRYAAEKYNTIDEGLIHKALEYAEASRVYPNNIEITEALWIRAHTGAIRAYGKPADNETQTHAKNVYNIIGSGAHKLQREALAESLAPPNHDAGKEHLKLLFFPRVDVIGFSYLFFGSVASVVIFKENHQQMLLVLSFIVAWYLFGELYFVRRISIDLITRIIFWCGGVVVPIIWIYNYLSPDNGDIGPREIFLGVFTIPFVFILTFIYDRTNRERMKPSSTQNKEGRKD